jgi:hypothetical protein
MRRAVAPSSRKGADTAAVNASCSAGASDCAAAGPHSASQHIASAPARGPGRRRADIKPKNIKLNTIKFNDIKLDNIKLDNIKPNGQNDKLDMRSSRQTHRAFTRVGPHPF